MFHLGLQTLHKHVAFTYFPLHNGKLYAPSTQTELGKAFNCRGTSRYCKHFSTLWLLRQQACLHLSPGMTWQANDMSSKCIVVELKKTNKHLAISFRRCMIVKRPLYFIQQKVPLFPRASEIAPQQMFVWHNEFCPGISPMSCKKKSPRIPERRSSYLELREGTDWSGCLMINLWRVAG